MNNKIFTVLAQYGPVDGGKTTTYDFRPTPVITIAIRKRLALTIASAVMKHTGKFDHETLLYWLSVSWVQELESEFGLWELFSMASEELEGI